MKPFGMRDKLGYFLGDFGTCFFFVMTGSFLTAFYTDVLGVSGGLVGAVFFLARLFSAVTDVGMGRLVDCAKPSPLGKFRPWVRRLAVPLTVSGVLLFLPLSGLPAGLKTAYALVTYFLYMAMYSGMTVPYGAMAAVMTGASGERAALSTYRNVGSSLSSALVSFLIPAICFVPTASGDGEQLDGGRFLLMALLFGAAALVSFLLCAHMCTERIPPRTQPGGAERGGVCKMVRDAAHNRPFLVLCATAVVLLLSQQVGGTITTYVYKDYFRQPKLLAVAGVLITVCTFLLAPFVSRIVNRFGKKESVVAATLTSGVLNLLVGVLHITNVWVFLALTLLANFGAAFFNTVVWALVLDAINYQELLTGERSEASIYALYSFARKIGQALAGGLGGATLALVGYISATGGQAVVQSRQTVDSIYYVATLVPGAAYLVIAALMLFAYPLTKKKVDEMEQTLWNTGR